MEELLTVDGNQYKIAYDQPLTIEQRIQTIEDIRKQTGCGCSEMNNMNNLSLSLETIQSLQPGTYTQSATVMMLAPAHVWISNISVVSNAQTANCPCGTPPSCGTISCDSSIECSDWDCAADTGNITVTFSNSGDKAGNLSAISLNLNGIGPISPDGTVPTSVPAKSGGTPGTATATFSGKTLVRGSNSISVTYTWSR